MFEAAEPLIVFIPDSPNSKPTRKVLKRRPGRKI
jgi:hypothetical protein